MCIHPGMGGGGLLKERQKEKEIRNAGQTVRTQKLEAPSMWEEASEGKEGRLCTAGEARSSLSGNCHIFCVTLRNHTTYLSRIEHMKQFVSGVPGWLSR